MSMTEGGDDSMAPPMRNQSLTMCMWCEEDKPTEEVVITKFQIGINIHDLGEVRSMFMCDSCRGEVWRSGILIAREQA
jgi:hypothetical protein